MKNVSTCVRRLISLNCRMARQVWGSAVGHMQICSLREITARSRFSLRAGDLLLLQGSWYVTHTGLIGLARRHRCAGMAVEAITQFCDTNAARWTFKATVYKTEKCKGFVGYGDADPSNVSDLVRGAEMRVAETRAVNRALRKAYGIGICSVEEIGFFAEAAQPVPRGRRNFHRNPPTETTAVPRSAIASARSSASINSIPLWSRPTPRTFAVPRLCATPRASRSKTLSSTWPTGRRKTAMPCSVS